jgi:hypothetical protein
LLLLAGQRSVKNQQQGKRSGPKQGYRRSESQMKRRQRLSRTGPPYTIRAGGPAGLALLDEPSGLAAIAPVASPGRRGQRGPLHRR